MPYTASSLNPDLTVPDSVVEEWISLGFLEINGSRNRSVDWTFAERAR
jgi:hypothetical protein